MVELYDLNSDYKTSYIWNFDNFFNLEEDEYLFPFDYSLFELNKESTYFLAIIPKVIIYEEMLNATFIKKFRFKSFDSEAFEEISSVSFNDYLNNEIINTFFMDDYRILVVLTFAELEGNIYPNGGLQRRRRMVQQYYYDYVFKFYNHNLQTLSYANNKFFSDNYIYDLYYQEEKYLFKSIYLGKQYAIFAFVWKYYFSNYGDLYIQFELVQMNYCITISQIGIIKSIGELLYNFDFYESLFDFIKVDNNRLAFIYSSTKTQIDPDEKLRRMDIPNNDRQLFIILIDINKNTKDLTTRVYHLFLENLVPKMKLSAYVYNSYLLFATTAILEGDNSNYGETENYFSIFMIFGYANGTDNIIDISNYLSDHENCDQQINKFYELLNGTFTIENNIFEYKYEGNIKIVYIPQEVILLKKDSNKYIQLENELLYVFK